MEQELKDEKMKQNNGSGVIAEHLKPENKGMEELDPDKLESVSGGYPVFRDFSTVQKEKEKDKRRFD